MVRRLMPLFLLLFLAGCNRAPTPIKQDWTAFADSTHDPRTDLYRFANARWAVVTQPHSYLPSWNMLTETEERNLARTDSLLRWVYADRNRFPEGTVLRSVANFYKLGLDTTSENRALKLLKADLDKVDEIKTGQELSGYLAQCSRANRNPYFSMRKLGNEYVIQAAALPLAPRHYIDNSPQAKELRAEYLAHIANQLSRLGVAANVAQREAALALGVETAIARITLQKEEPVTKMATTNLGRVTGWDWPTFLTLASVGTDSLLVHGQYTKEVCQLLVGNVKNQLSFLRWQRVYTGAPDVNGGLAQAHHTFFSRLDPRHRKPHWQKRLSDVALFFNPTLTQLFAKELLPANADSLLTELTVYHKLAIAGSIKDSTRPDSVKRAMLKYLSAVRVNIEKGYAPGDYPKIDTSILFYVCKEQLLRTSRPVQPVFYPWQASVWLEAGSLLVSPGLLQRPIYHISYEPAQTFGGLGFLLAQALLNQLIAAYPESEAPNTQQRAFEIAQQAFTRFMIEQNLAAPERIRQSERFRLAWAMSQRSLSGESDSTHAARVNSILQR